MNFRFITMAFTLSSTFLCLPLAALAQEERDVLISANAANAEIIATGSLDDATGDITIPVRVFAAALAQFPGVDQLDGGQGFVALSDAGLLPPGFVPLPPLVDVRFDFRTIALDGPTRSNFWFWDALANPAQVSFSPVSDGRTCSFRKTPSSVFNATVDGADQDVTGFVIDRTGTSGQIHKHLTIVLNDADEDLGTPVQPGIYLVAYRLAYGTAQSEIVYEVINGNLPNGEAASTMAVEYINDLLSGPPCVGDLDGSGTVDLTDLATLLSHFGATGATAAEGDTDADGDVDLSDLAALLGRFGTTC